MDFNKNPSGGYLCVGGHSGSVSWSLEDSVLTFDGSGAAGNYGSAAILPWGSNYSQLIVKPGVTGLGCYMFKNCTNLNKVVIADSVTSIDEDAFSGVIFNDYDGVTVLDKTVANLSGHTFAGSAGNLQLMRNGFTAIYKFANGTKAADDIYRNIAPGTQYSIDSPTVAGYSPSIAKVEGTLGESSDWEVIIYRPNTYTLTIQYVDALDESVLSTTTNSVTYGQGYNYSVSSRTGYTAEKSTVSGTMDAEGKTEIVLFTPIKYVLNIQYLNYSDYSQMAPTYSEEIYYGRHYEVDSPVFEHMSVNYEKVSGTMSNYGRNETVYYYPTEYNLTIQLKDGSGNRIGEDVIRHVGYGQPYNIVAPTVIGYSSTQVLTGTMDAEGKSVDCVYSAKIYTMSIKYTLAETGREIDTIDYDVAFNADYSFDSPAMAGYTPSHAKIEGKMDAEGKNANVVYYINSHDVNVSYVFEDGTKAAEPYSVSVVYGKTFVIASPRVSNYNADLTAVSGTMGDSDLNFEVVFYPTTYRVTVYYIYSDGSAAADAHTMDVAFGKDFSIASPVLAGYVADKSTVSGTIGAADVSYNVTYSSNGGSSHSNGGSSGGSDSSGSTINTVMIGVVGVIAAMSLACSIMVLRKR